MTGVDETKRVRRIYETNAPHYDRQIAFFERILFDGGRAWVASQAAGQVLEIAVGTGRNLSHCPKDVRLTGVDLSPAMLEIAHRRAADLSRRSTFARETRRHWSSPTPASTP